MDDVKYWAHPINPYSKREHTQERRYIVNFDREYFKERTPRDVEIRLGGSMENVINHSLNLWPWIGYNECNAAIDVLEDLIALGYGREEDSQVFYSHVDRCYRTVLGVLDYLRPVLPSVNPPIPGVEDNNIVTGGQVEKLTNSDLMFKMYFEDM